LQGHEAIHQAIGALLQVCDGAHAKDSAGFNAIDAGFCRWLAAKHPDWSGSSAYRAWEILRKYRGQLSGFGIDYDRIPVPDREAPRPARPERPTPVRTIELLYGFLHVVFPYDPMIVGVVRSIPGAQFERSRKTWEVPLTVESAVPVLKLAHEHSFAFAKGTAEGIHAYVDELEKAKEASKAIISDVQIYGLGGILRPFQIAGVAYVSAKNRALIADEMGLGKTVETLAAIHHKGAYPAVVVCPASVKHNWKREANKWLPHISVAVLDSGDEDPRADLTIINYDLLKKWITRLEKRRFKAVIFDESHFLKNKKAQRTQFAKALASKIPMRLLLSGTPVLNRPVELCSQLEILGRLHEFGGWWRFVERYCDMKKEMIYLPRNRWTTLPDGTVKKTRTVTVATGASNLEELNDKLRSVCMIRRTKEEVLPEMPPKVRSVLEVEIDNYDEYQEAQANTIEWLGEKAAKELEWQLSVVHLDKYAIAEAKRKRSEEVQEKARRAEVLVRIEALKQLAAAGKMASIKEWIENFLEGDGKLVVFAHHRSVQKELLEAFDGVSARIVSEDSAEERQAQVDRFQTDPACRLMVASLMAGGVGITLTAASNVLFTELGWTPAAHSQAEDRCHRIGQHDSVTAWYMLGKDTIDMDIHELLEEKEEVVISATDGRKVKGPTQDSILGNLVTKLLHKNYEGQPK